MTIRVALRENESLEDALRRFNKHVNYLNGRRWCKRRYGYYEKPSAIRRKQKKMHHLNQHGKILKLHIGQKELLARTGPTNAAGR